MGSTAGEFQLGPRVAAWRAREAELRRRGEVDLAGHAPGLAPPPLDPAARAAWEWALPLATLRREVEAALILALGRERLLASGVALEATRWGRAAAWPEARRRLRLPRALAWPSELLARLEDPAYAEAFLADCADPPGFGTALGRYPARLQELAALAPPGPALDVGTGTGEGAWELLAARPGHAVLGIDRCPLLVELAGARRAPHDPTREAALQALAADLDPARLRFAVADVTQPLPGRYAAIACHGVLGEAVRGPALAPALEHLIAALLPGGVLSLSHRFRDDRAAALDAAIEAAVLAHDLERLGPALVRRPDPSDRCAPGA